MECMSVERAIKALLAQEGLTQGQLAQMVGVCREVLNRTIRKPDHRITADLLPIAAALGCRLELRFVRDDGSTAAVVPYAASTEQGREE